jgi:hypothetical protein
MTQLQKIVAKAKSLKKSYPNTKWTDLIKKASKLVTPAKKSVSGIKRTIVKKSAPAIPLVKKRIETKSDYTSDFAMAGIKKKKATKKAVKKSPARSMHKDTKSHNVNIRVMSGINKHLVQRISKINDEIEQRENVIFSVIERKKDLIARNGADWYKKWIKDAKGIVSELKKHKSELKRFI